jgi:hypothetical protein
MRAQPCISRNNLYEQDLLSFITNQNELTPFSCSQIHNFEIEVLDFFPGRYLTG